MLALCEREEEEGEKGGEGRTRDPASREHVKVLPRSAGAKSEKKKGRKRGKDEKRTRSKKKKK